MAYRVRLDVFEGPLDLLLHLVKKNEVDLSDLPVATITDQYISYIDLLQQLDLDRAGEYLVMAATLLHLKSRLLLPSEEVVDEESGEDPRAELARQLLEYQRFREAAEMLDRNSMLGRDVFTRVPLRNEAIDGQDVVRDVMDEIYDVSLGDLLDALQEVLKNAEPGIVHQVLLEQVSLRERVCLVLDLLRERTQVAFTDLFSTDISRLQILVTFLAALELVRTRIIDINQDERFGPIMLTLAVSADAPLPETLEQL
jgi:segregation and condensation protein A